LVRDAGAEFFGPRQIYWMERLDREAPNVREALEFSLSDSDETKLEITGILYHLGIARGRLSETRRWLDRALAATPPEPTRERITGLYGAAMIAGLQGDLPAATALVADGQALVKQMADPEAHAMMSIADGFTALVSGEFDRACARSEDAVGTSDEPSTQIAAMLLLGWGLEFRGEIGRALIWQEKALALAESIGESVYRGIALWCIGVGWWRHGKPDRAEQLLKDGLRLTHRVNDPRQAAACLQGLAWIAGAKHNSRRAVVLTAAARALGNTVGASAVMLPHLGVFHDECERSAREALGAEEFEAARQQGYSLSFDEAVAQALQETA
jgi:serine/threonine-protein kinase PknK